MELLLKFADPGECMAFVRVLDDAYGAAVEYFKQYHGDIWRDREVGVQVGFEQFGRSIHLHFCLENFTRTVIVECQASLSELSSASRAVYSATITDHAKPKGEAETKQTLMYVQGKGLLVASIAS